MLVNSRMPLTLNSRPWPERLTPPKGMRGSDATIWLMKTMPASSSLMNRVALAIVIGPGAGAQAVAMIVGHANGFFGIFHAKDGSYRAK